jgi:hypothetical protein
MTNLQDTDSIIESFIVKCHQAGPAKCPLYSHVGIEAMRTTYFDTIQKIADNPLPVPAHGELGPEIITHQDIMSVIIPAVYAPASGFSRLARIIQDLSLGNGSELAKWKQSTIPSTCRSPICTGKPWSGSCHDPTFVSTISFKNLNPY